MRSISLNSLDLNLLLALEALFEERNVTRAAARIGVGQPAMSSALSRLRQLFDDPLFVRSGGVMTPTPHARELAIAVTEAMRGLRNALEHDASFDPATSSRTFHFATTDYCESIVLPAIVTRMFAEAPSISLRITRAPLLFHAPIEALESGDADGALGFFRSIPHNAHEAVLSTTLFEERLVCVVRRSHSRIRTRVTLADFTEVPQARIVYPGDSSVGLIDVLLRSKGLERRVALTVPHFLPLLDIAAETDLLCVVPERLARRFADELDLRILSCPISIPTIPVSLLWPARLMRDDAHEWLRGQFVAAAEEWTSDVPGTKSQHVRR